MYTIIITLRDGSTETKTESFDWAAHAICIEEIQWENTQRVVCEALGFDEEGSFV
jgi:hypothetical protein